ncbi:EH signature domain-containing protein [Moritella viscosa]|uniref:EH signature domain-containing protein n=1 Tax=Moritella viscosa TaxID=80854 RepID=UPI0009158DEF|nr:EH signature domain-containing protein [Moritella viscosa]SGZ02147.1 Putative uncharacterized protein [Moritella viscosa]
MVKINVTKLSVNIPSSPFGNNLKKLSNCISELKKITKRAGMDSDKFKHSWERIIHAAKNNQQIEKVLNSKIDVRALGFALASEFKSKIEVTPSLLKKVDQITDIPSTIFTEYLFQYYLSEYNRINHLSDVSKWLVSARRKRNLNEWYDNSLISTSGPKWVTDLAISKKKDFDQVISELQLDQFQSGQYMELAQRIYYVEQLKIIPVNQPNELLIEVQKPEVYSSKFNEVDLLGHQILNILIDKAPAQNIHESWLNVIMAIAGDPRIPKSHPRYIKWWNNIPKHLISKVQGWLSRLDLKLFLEALEDFSNSSSDPEMKRMYPSRKRFLEGLYDKKLIVNTRLYMSRKMSSYLKNNYKAEHLPNFSTISDGDKSIIYVDLGSAHLVEGSHSCYLWIYKSLDPSATIYNYAKTKESYSGLTSALNYLMEQRGHGVRARITHNPSNFSWQRNAVESLNELGCSISMKNVLTDLDYRVYVRRFGAN